jgi:hypothetical protein
MNIRVKPPPIRYATVTRNPKQITQLAYLAKSYGVPTIEIIKDDVVEEIQVPEIHLRLAKAMMGAP